ncbi:MAG TPA: hypothetical protein VK172_04005 [Lentimicrobium sp.]|nr:hypothetical protein [Lentimicrobium sp.]
MTSNRLFVSYAIEEKQLFDSFIEQSKKEKVPYELVYLEAKEPLSPEWREECKNRIESCQGVIFLISKLLSISEGAFWEMKYSHDLNKPMISVFVGDAGIRDKPRDLTGVMAMVLSWERITDFMEKIQTVSV